MAALTIDPADVGFGEATNDNSGQVRYRLVQVGEAVDAGELVYLKSSDNKYWLALNNGTEEQANVAGLTQGKAPENGYVMIQQNGLALLGTSASTAGETFVLGTTAGTIEPVGDLATGERITYVGFGPDADSIDLNFVPTGITKPA